MESLCNHQPSCLRVRHGTHAILHSAFDPNFCAGISQDDPTSEPGK